VSQFEILETALAGWASWGVFCSRLRVGVPLRKRDIWVIARGGISWQLSGPGPRICRAWALLHGSPGGCSTPALTTGPRVAEETPDFSQYLRLRLGPLPLFKNTLDLFGSPTEVKIFAVELGNIGQFVDVEQVEPAPLQR
jgi:hypothetical protein